MSKKLLIIIACGAFFCSFFTGCTDEVPLVELQVKDQEKKVDVLIDGQLFTSYIYPETIKKPVLWPVISPGGNALTRSFPLGKKEGERTDHPHHVGIWLNYGDVNGLDFWNNSDAIPPEKRDGYGTIYHRSVEKAESGKGKATLSAVSEWVSPSNEVLLTDNTTFNFSVSGGHRIIDRETRLTAMVDTVLFKDNKEGVFAIRVARELELPSDQPVTLTDAHGVETTVKEMDNTNVTGNYHSSEGIEGEDVWGTRGRWMKLNGTINNEQVTLVIIDHPGNVGYPTYWHARGYGLFAANTLGHSIFPNGKELNYRLTRGETLTLKYRLVIASGNLTDDEIDQMEDEFAEK